MPDEDKIRVSSDFKVSNYCFWFLGSGTALAVPLVKDDRALAPEGTPEPEQHQYILSMFVSHRGF